MLLRSSVGIVFCAGFPYATLAHIWARIRRINTKEHNYYTLATFGDYRILQLPSCFPAIPNPYIQKVMSPASSMQITSRFLTGIITDRLINFLEIKTGISPPFQNSLLIPSFAYLIPRRTTCYPNARIHSNSAAVHNFKRNLPKATAFRTKYQITGNLPPFQNYEFCVTDLSLNKLLLQAQRFPTYEPSAERTQHRKDPIESNSFPNEISTLHQRSILCFN